jgi:redox-sensitive bicupin YhaK (pirin superfamily)
MLSLRRNSERRHLHRGKHHTWLTFQPREPGGPPADGFGVLAALDETRLAPGGVSAFDPREGAEIITYVFRGALAQQDSTGSSGVVHAGEFQRMTIGRGVRHKETNASLTDWVHLFRISLHPSEAWLESGHEQRRFALAQRHNVLCVAASPDGRHGSLRVLQDALVYSSVLDPGHHLIHALVPERSVWLHVICGEAALPEFILGAGDGAGVTNGPSVSFTSQEVSEVLLIDLGPVPRPLASGVVP